MEPQYRFCRSADGTRIAYATWGSGPPLLYANTLLLGMDAQLTLIPEARAYFGALAARTTIIMFDRRGCGSSDREVDDLSVQAEAADIAAVADAANLIDFTLFADIASAPCALYTIEHPQHVRRLVLWCPVIGTRPESVAARVCREDWSYWRRLWASRMYPDGPVSLQRAANKVVKASVSAEMAARRLETEWDLAAFLPQVTVPTLVLQRQDHPREDPMRYAGLLGSGQLQFVPGPSSIPYPLHEAIVEAVAEFMGLNAPAAPGGRFTTVLFTDIVESTPIMRGLGDAGWRELLRTHETMTRDALARHAGVEIKTIGDAFMASFDSASRALECAVDLQQAFAAHNAGDPATAMLVRIGLNAGEPVADGDDLFGAAVTLAARIQGEAQGGEILVSDVVRQLVAGRKFEFADRGEFVPKGFDEPVRLYEVRWREGDAK